MRCYIIRTKRKKGDKRNMSFSPEKLFVCTVLSTIPFVTKFLNYIVPLIPLYVYPRRGKVKSSWYITLQLVPNLKTSIEWTFTE